MKLHPPTAVTFRYLHTENCCNSRRTMEIGVSVHLDTESLIPPTPPVCVRALPGLVELGYIGMLPTYPPTDPPNRETT